MKAYPLQWPKGWPKTEPSKREHSQFKQSLAAAIRNLRKQIDLMGGTSLVLSSNCALGDERPPDSGVVAYFQIKDQPMAIPCDRWKHVEDNVHAIALTVDAMRGMKRWGASHMITAMFSGFKSLPEKAGVDYRAIIGVGPTEVLTEALISAAYKQKAKTEHPDTGGTAERWAALREAHDMLMQNVRNAK